MFRDSRQGWIHWVGLPGRPVVLVLIHGSRPARAGSSQALSPDGSQERTHRYLEDVRISKGPVDIAAGGISAWRVVLPATNPYVTAGRPVRHLCEAATRANGSETQFATLAIDAPQRLGDRRPENGFVNHG